MTEKEYYNCKNFEELINCLDKRKQRLFTCAFVRELSDFISIKEFYNCIDAAEKLADGLITNEQVYRIRKATHNFKYRRERKYTSENAYYQSDESHLLNVATECTSIKYFLYAAKITSSFFKRKIIIPKNDEISLIKEIYYPFYKKEVKISDTTKELAKETYNNFKLKNILADLLEDENQDEFLINHLRNNCLGVKGCWVVDRLLGF